MSYGAILNQDPSTPPMLPQILITPIVPLSSVTASNGLITYNGIYNGSVWVIDVDDFGDYNITAVKADGSGTSEDVVSVTVNRQYEIELGAPTILPILNDNSWEAISYVSANNLGASYWAVGDAKQITLNGTIGLTSYNNYQPWVYILGFNHNANLEGNNLIHFGCFRSVQNYGAANSIALDDFQYGNMVNATGYYNMNSSQTNYGGWLSSYMRNTLINNTANNPATAATNSFLAILPNELQAVLKQCTKYTDNTGYASGNIQSNVTATQDWAFLLSEYELFGTRTYANSYEQNYQEQYNYYAVGNNKRKFLQSSTGTVCQWNLRSPQANSSTNFCINRSNTSATGNGSTSFGFAPAFCV